MPKPPPAPPTHVFIGRRPCGCVTAVVNDDDDNFTRATVMEYTTNGLTVSRITWETYREQISGDPTFMKCNHRFPIQATTTVQEVDKLPVPLADSVPVLYQQVITGQHFYWYGNG